MVLRLITRGVILPTAGVATGFFTFGKAWSTGRGADERQARSEEDQNKGAISKIRSDGEYQRASRAGKRIVYSELIPGSFRHNNVSQGLLFGKGSIEIDPVLVMEEEAGRATSYYQVGRNVSGGKDRVHEGLLSLFLDETLCICGFPSLPNQRGFTGKLKVRFLGPTPPESLVRIRAEVVEAKGRKCVIRGRLETMPEKGWLWGERAPVVLAEAECVLVEPKWLKYFPDSSFI